MSAVSTLLHYDEPAVSLADQAYRTLLDQIITLKRLPGEVLSEEDLRRQLNTGRTPIREALQRLAADNLVVVLPRRGTLVSEMNIMDLSAIYEVRVELEALAARLAAERFADDASPVDVEAEPTTLGGIDDFVQLVAVDRRLHKEMYRLAKNPYLEAELERYLNLSIRLTLGATRRLPAPPIAELLGAIAEFRGIFAAIRARNADEAATLARHHTGFSAMMIRQIV